MKSSTQILRRAIHISLGLALIAAAVLPFLSSRGFCPVGESMEHFSALSEALHHADMELGATFLFAGSLLIWRAFNLQKGQFLFPFFLLLFVLLSAIHWYEYAMGNRDIISPVINSLPLVLILIDRFITQDSESP